MFNYFLIFLLELIIVNVLNYLKLILKLNKIK